MSKFLTDTHVHTSGISVCSKVSVELAAARYAKEGVRTIVLSNHYNKYQLYYHACTAQEFAVKFIEEYRTCKYFAGDKLNVLLGAEVALSLKGCDYAEFLLLGLDEKFLIDNYDLYTLKQEELFALAAAAGALMIQTHPYRSEQGHFPHNPKLMHGVEINCHPDFLRNEEKVKAFAKDNGLFVTCGSDFHTLKQAGSAGITTFAEIKSSKDLVGALRSNAYEIYYK